MNSKAQLTVDIIAEVAEGRLTISHHTSTNYCNCYSLLKPFAHSEVSYVKFLVKLKMTSSELSLIPSVRYERLHPKRTN